VSSEELTREVERPPGRPRSEEAHRAILDAAIDLFLEQGLEAMSIEGVAAKAGVGKTTIYRRWESKEELIVAAIDEVIFDVEATDTGSLRDDLIDVAVNVQTIFASSKGSRMFARMVPHVVADTPLGRAHHERIIGPRFARLEGIIARGIERGELRPDVNPEMVRALMVGPVLMWMLMHQLTEKGIKKRAVELVDSILPGLLA
jgi:AcrR family transcriptional regulator